MSSSAAGGISGGGYPARPGREGAIVKGLPHPIAGLNEGEGPIEDDKMEGKRSSKGREVWLSVVIPLFKEEENIETLYLRLKEVLEGLGIGYEMVIIDDGSTDGGFAILKRLHKTDHLLKAVRLRRNLGQTAAFAAGFDHARGQIIVTMDADLQNDPGDIPLLLEKIEEGYDVVSGWRVKRRDPLLTRRLPSLW